MPELRAFIRTRFCDGLYPQMLLRLGEPEGPQLVAVRRSVDDVVINEG